MAMTDKQRAKFETKRDNLAEEVFIMLLADHTGELMDMARVAYPVKMNAIETLHRQGRLPRYSFERSMGAMVNNMALSVLNSARNLL